MALSTSLAELKGKLCAGYTRARCDRNATVCASGGVYCVAGRCRIAEQKPALASISVPMENRATSAKAPPRPQLALSDSRPRRLFNAIKENDPARVRDFFFPEEAFVQVKAMAKSSRYWQRLFNRFETDIHALHASRQDWALATFERLEVVKRGGYVKRGEEGNRLPYWAARHNRLHFSVAGRRESIEVRVMIAWGKQWYVIHLSEFH